MSSLPSQIARDTSEQAGRYRPRTRLAPEWTGTINALSRPRSPYEGALEASPVRLAIDGVTLDGGALPPGFVQLDIVFGRGGRLPVLLPERAVGHLLRTLQPDLSDDLPEATVLLLLELALAPLLDRAEGLLGDAMTVDRLASPRSDDRRAYCAVTAHLGEKSWPLRLPLGMPGEPPDPETVRVLLALCAAMAPRRAAVPRLPVALSFVAGSTRLTAAELAGLSPGDALLPDVWHPANGEVSVTLFDRFGTQAATGRGGLRVKAALSRLVDRAASSSHALRDRMVMAQAEESVAAAEETGKTGADPGVVSVETLPVDVTFELARRTLDYGELGRIGAGHVFDLGIDPIEAVDLRANGVRIGRGEIVEVGERLGVRVVRLFGDGRSR